MEGVIPLTLFLNFEWESVLKKACTGPCKYKLYLKIEVSYCFIGQEVGCKLIKPFVKA